MNLFPVYTQKAEDTKSKVQLLKYSPQITTFQSSAPQNALVYALPLKM